MVSTGLKKEKKRIFVHGLHLNKRDVCGVQKLLQEIKTKMCYQIIRKNQKVWVVYTLSSDFLQIGELKRNLTLQHHPMVITLCKTKGRGFDFREFACRLLVMASKN